MNLVIFEVVVDFKKAKASSKWGVIPFRYLESGDLEVLIISTKRKNWSLPKGNLIKSIGPKRTALLEAYEEAGIDGQLVASTVLCSIGRTNIFLFPMSVSKVFEDWPESGFRKRRWVSKQKASRILHHHSMRSLLGKFLPKACLSNS